MRILITGAGGQLGSELQAVIRAGKSPIGEIDPVYKTAEVMTADIGELDITGYDTTMRFIAGAKPDIIINCAAMTNVDGCESRPDEAMAANAIGPRNLAAAAEAAGAKLCHVSTDYVFPGDSSVPYREWDRPDPQTVYGKSKLLGEEYVKSLSSRYFIVRTAWLYGTCGHNFVRTMLKLGSEKESVNVVNDQTGCPTNAADLAHHILALVLTGDYGIYHVSGAGQCSWFEFAQKIMEYAGLGCRVIPCTSAEYPSRTPRPSYSVMDSAALRLSIGDRMRPWDEALKDFIEKNILRQPAR